jgi:hypothetical protein
MYSATADVAPSSQACVENACHDHLKFIESIFHNCAAICYPRIEIF